MNQAEYNFLVMEFNRMLERNQVIPVCIQSIKCYELGNIDFMEFKVMDKWIAIKDPPLRYVNYTGGICNYCMESYYKNKSLRK